jgi:hypothetical protein
MHSRNAPLDPAEAHNVMQRRSCAEVAKSMVGADIHQLLVTCVVLKQRRYIFE